MQYRFFRISVRNSEAFEKDLNSFLASVKVISVKDNFIDNTLVNKRPEDLLK